MGQYADTELSLNRLEQAEAELRAAKAKVERARFTHRHFLEQANIPLGNYVRFGGRTFVYTGGTDGLVEVNAQYVPVEGDPFA